uniref:Uncharacterized protein n=1 Tax=Panagrolaimus sp. JU765 TaxID=591449 RepID=A0AC34QLN7_9BILA
MMPLTKIDRFFSGDWSRKSITDVPGIGVVSGLVLRNQGFGAAADLYAWFKTVPSLIFLQYLLAYGVRIDRAKTVLAAMIGVMFAEVVKGRKFWKFLAKLDPESNLADVPGIGSVFGQILGNDGHTLLSLLSKIQVAPMAVVAVLIIGGIRSDRVLQAYYSLKIWEYFYITLH